MRPIKFRAKSIKVGRFGEWVYGDLHIRSPFAHIHEDIGKRAPIDPDTIGQFTGLTDKNGKEIYENDIIALRRRGRNVSTSKVVWCHRAAAFVRVVPTDEIEDTYYISESDMEAFEVIGNVHDNPELLNE